jgi:hypothetical protein
VPLLKKPVRHDLPREKMRGLPEKKNSALSISVRVKTKFVAAQKSFGESSKQWREGGEEVWKGSVAGGDESSLESSAMNLANGVAAYVGDTELREKLLASLKRLANIPRKDAGSHVNSAESEVLKAIHVIYKVAPEDSTRRSSGLGYLARGEGVAVAGAGEGTAGDGERDGERDGGRRSGERDRSDNGKGLCTVLVRRGGPANAPVGSGTPMLAERKGDRMRLYVKNSGNSGNSSLQRIHNVDLHGATIMAGSEERRQQRGHRAHATQAASRSKFALEIRRNSPFEFTPDDFELTFTSASEVEEWELKLIKGVVHRMKAHAPSSNGSEFVPPLSMGNALNSSLTLFDGALAPERGSGVSGGAGSGGASRAGGEGGRGGLEAIAAALASHTAATGSGEGGGDWQQAAERRERGLTREQVETVGTTFVYSRRRMPGAAAVAGGNGSDKGASV